MIVDKNETIDVSFKVKPSDAAYADYASKQQYPDTEEAIPAMNPQESKDTSPMPERI